PRRNRAPASAAAAATGARRRPSCPWYWLLAGVGGMVRLVWPVAVMPKNVAVPRGLGQLVGVLPEQEGVPDQVGGGAPDCTHKAVVSVVPIGTRICIGRKGTPVNEEDQRLLEGASILLVRWAILVEALFRTFERKLRTCPR